MFVLLAYDHTLTLLNYGTPCLHFGIIRNCPLVWQCAWWLFIKFSTNQCLSIILTFEFTFAFSCHGEMHEESLIGHPIGHPLT
jgi:hypothetical protein